MEVKITNLIDASSKNFPILLTITYCTIKILNGVNSRITTIISSIMVKLETYVRARKRNTWLMNATAINILCICWENNRTEVDKFYQEIAVYQLKFLS